jgi:putative glutamine amidotransferase
MPAPIIGVTTNYIPAQPDSSGQFAISEKYTQAVLRAGGLPVILPLELPADSLAELLSRIDGLLLTGGADIDPARFDGASHPRVYGVMESRDDQELRLVRLAAEQGKPFLGICRGIQVINVALGGTLYTDIGDQMPNALKHDQFPGIPRDYLAHEVAVESGSLLEKALGGRAFAVNSLHHQGVERLAPGLKAVACAPDRLIEAVELPGHPFGLGVQWHPEWLQEHAPQRQLLRAFVDSARAAQ